MKQPNNKNNDVYTLAHNLALWINNLEYDQVPYEVINSAKRCIIDVTGVSIAGSNNHISMMSRQFASQQYPPGPCTVIGTKNRSSVLGASFCNGVAAHCLDFDDTCYDGIVHGSAAIWPVALAVGEMIGASGKQFLTAFIAGAECIYKLGRFFTDHLYMKGWWNSSVLGIIGAAACASKLLSFNEALTMNAIQNAACFSFGPKALLGTSLKPTAMGVTASEGIKAALFAKEGVAGPKDIFESKTGIVNLFNDGVQNSDFSQVFSDKYSLNCPGIAFKLYPVCSAAQAAGESLQKVLVNYRLKYNDITQVICEVTHLVKISLVYDQPINISEAQFSMPFVLGCILTYGTLSVEHLNMDILNNNILKHEMKKIKIYEVENINNNEFDPILHPEGCLIKIITKNNKQIEVFNGAATGMPINPMSNGQLSEKFKRCASGTLTNKNAEYIINNIWKLENLENIKFLFNSKI